MSFHGQRIRSLREGKKLSLQELADQCGLTRSYLSKVERSTKAPPVATIQTICRALGIDLQELLTLEASPLPPEPFSRNLDVVRARDLNGKNLVQTDAGYDYHPLMVALRNKYMAPVLMHLQKGKTEFFKHDAEEFDWVLEGTVHFFYERKVLTLEPGDSIYFDSRLPHAFAAVGAKKAILMSVVLPYRRF